MIRALLVAIFVLLSGQAALANARITVLMDVLRISDVVEIMREEGFAYAEELDTDMLDGRGGAFWRAQVGQIYRADPILERVRTALEQGLTPDEIDAVIAFFGAPEGARIIALENAARRAMADPTVEEAVRALFDDRSGSKDPMTRIVTAFIEANDLVERNLSGAMTANAQFFLGLSDGGYIEDTESQILENVWSQQKDIRLDTENWLNGFLFMAYEPLPDDVMQSYLTFSTTQAGQALNAALFEGFEGVYREISYALGRAVALQAEGDEI
ncbi:MAG: DUF2059 domain-containing protein [Pseudomonadota bacterium]